MNTFVIKLVVWIVGCIVFDGLLQLQGSWLMLGGAATFAIMEMVSEAFK